MTPKYLKVRRAIIAAGRAMNAHGINQGTSGNVSVRVAGGYLITPSGVPYSSMTPGDIVLMRMNGIHEGRLRPSSEWRLHGDIYAGRPEATAVVHAHPPYCTALACLGQGIPPFHYMVAVAGGHDIRCADYATFGTQALSDVMMRALEERRACLLANHGMICFGPNLDGALALAVEVETLARQYMLARQVGEPDLLSRRQIDEVIKQFNRFGSVSA